MLLISGEKHKINLEKKTNNNNLIKTYFLKCNY